MVTIREVAERAGVSVATVSRVINNKNNVKEETENKVLNVIEELNYIPNNIARTLYTKKSNTIGLVIPDITNPFFSEFYKQLEQSAEKYEQELFLFNSDYKLEREKVFLDILTSKSIDSAIIISDTLSEADLETINIPIVTVDRKISNNISSISIQNFEGGQKAVQYLISKKCKKIAHLSGDKDNIVAKDRKKGFVYEAEKNKMDYIVTESSYDIKKSVEDSIRLLTQYPQIDGIFAGNDIIAVGLVKALSKMKLKRKISIIGFDGIKLGKAITPEITTLVQPIEKIAFEAIEIIMKNKTKLHKKFAVDLLVRDT